MNTYNNVTTTKTFKYRVVLVTVTSQLSAINAETLTNHMQCSEYSTQMRTLHVCTPNQHVFNRKAESLCDVTSHDETFFVHHLLKLATKYSESLKYEL